MPYDLISSVFIRVPLICGGAEQDSEFRSQEDALDKIQLVAS